MLTFVRNHPYGTAGTAAALVAGLAWVAFGFFGIHTLFVDDVVSEAAPVFDTPAPDADDADTAPSEAATARPVTAESTDRSGDLPANVWPDDAPTETSQNEPAAPATDTQQPDTQDTPTVAGTAGTASPEIVTEYAGDFVGDAHPTSGRAVVLGNGTGQRFLRFEDFETDNGPDLNVYLVNSSTGDVSDYVDLGDLTGNIGEQNYEIPADVDLDVYDTVVIWCVRFGVGFGEASLAAA